jgi:hypothetical protein
MDKAPAFDMMLGVMGGLHRQPGHHRQRFDGSRLGATATDLGAKIAVGAVAAAGG